MTLTNGKGFIARERLFILVFSVFISLTLAHFVHDHWYFLSREPTSLAAPATGAITLIRPVLYAPNAYRVGMPVLGRFVANLLHVKAASAAAILDGFFCALSLLLLCETLITPTNVSKKPIPRVMSICCFFAAVQLPLNWVVPWQRPETMASSLFMAVALYCVCRQEQSWRWALTVLLACITLWQGFVRSDVCLSFGIGVLLVAVTNRIVKGNHADCKRQMFLGFIVTIISAGTQAYLQLMLFPHLEYPPDTPKFQALVNLRFFHNLEILLLAVTPLVAILAYGWYKNIRLLEFEKIALSTACVHFLFWFVLGSVGEVRIFVPSLLLLCVPAARTMTNIMLGVTVRPLHQ